MKKDKNIKSYRNSSIAFALFACVIMVIVCFEIYGIKQLKDRCTYKTKAVAEEVISRKNIDYVNGELTVQTTCTVVYSYKYDRNEYLEEGSAFSKISIKKGEIVDFYIDPNEPTVFYCPAAHLIYTWYIFVGAVCLIMFISIWYMRRYIRDMKYISNKQRADEIIFGSADNNANKKR